MPIWSIASPSIHYIQIIVGRTVNVKFKPKKKKEKINKKKSSHLALIILPFVRQLRAVEAVLPKVGRGQAAMMSAAMGLHEYNY